MDNPDSIFCYLKLEKAVFDVAKSAKKKSTKKRKYYSKTSLSAHEAFQKKCALNECALNKIVYI